MASSSLPGVLVFATAISGVVGGVVGGGVVLFGAALSDGAPAAGQIVPVATEVSDPTVDELQVEPLEEPLELDEPATPLPAPPRGPFDSSPAAERPPYALEFVVPADASDFVRQQVQGARAGDVDSMLRVADWLAGGAGLPQSSALANAWYRRARALTAGAPTSAAAHSMARAYAAFLAGPAARGGVNPEAALALLEESTRANPAAFALWLDLAEAIERGCGTEPDPERAREIVRRVAERLLTGGDQGVNEGRAYFLLARYLHRGVGGPADPHEAAIWARRGVEGQPEYLVSDDEILTAIDCLRGLEEVPGGVLWLRHFTEKHAPAAYFLAQCHEQGAWGAPRDVERALALYRQAAKLEHAHAPQDVERLTTVEVEASGE